MIIVKVWGGLGNQLFLYALYRGLQENGKEAKLDISSYKFIKAHGSGYLIPVVFENTRNEYAAPGECRRLAVYQSDLFHRALRRYGINKKTFVSQSRDYGSCAYSPEVLSLENAYLEGFFQSERYFGHIRDLLRRELVFRVPERYPNIYRESIMASNAVSIHVRRGDYLKNGYKRRLVFTTEYYKNAVAYIKEKVADPVFYVFSDELDWCREYFAGYGGSFCFVQQKEEAWFDMYLMSLCKHNIIADSSFSWWGAWLNRHDYRLVLYPEGWPFVIGLDKRDITPEEWIGIPLDS